MSPMPAAESVQMRPRPIIRAVFAAVLGNALEFYDFTTYAFFAVLIGRAFFPTQDNLTSLLLSVGTFGIGFLTRPIGGILIGAYADRAGRRPAMLLTIALMSLGTLILVVTPPYATIGIGAPLMIVLGRLIQGAALGGEVGPATAYLVEIAPAHRRGLYTSWQPASQGAAIIVAGALGLGLSLSLSPMDMASWGWRVPFALGLAIIPFGLYIRRSLPETMEQGSAKGSSGGSSTLPSLRDLIVDRPLPLLAITTQILFGTISIYVGNYMTTYAIATLHLSPSTAIASALCVGSFTLAGALLGGWLSDKYGRTIVMIIPRVVLLLVVYPLFQFVIQSPTAIGLLLVTSVITALSMTSGGALFPAIAEALPQASRSTGLSVCYAVVVSVFGGTTQLVVAGLIGVTGDAAVPAYYLMVVSAISLAALYWLPRPGRRRPADRRS